MEELEAAGQLDAELDSSIGDDRDEDGASDPVEDFIERVNNGEITELSLLDFDKLKTSRASLARTGRGRLPASPRCDGRNHRGSAGQGYSGVPCDCPCR